MIRWLVEDQKVGVGCGEARQSRPVALAAAEAADFLEDHIAGDAKAREQVASLLLDKFLVRRTHGIDYLHFLIQAREHLVEVTGLHAGAEDDATIVWF